MMMRYMCLREENQNSSANSSSNIGDNDLDSENNQEKMWVGHVTSPGHKMILLSDWRNPSTGKNAHLPIITIAAVHNYYIVCKK